MINASTLHLLSGAFSKPQFLLNWLQYLLDNPNASEELQDSSRRLVRHYLFKEGVIDDFNIEGIEDGEFLTAFRNQKRGFWGHGSTQLFPETVMRIINFSAGEKITLGEVLIAHDHLLGLEPGCPVTVLNAVFIVALYTQTSDQFFVGLRLLDEAIAASTSKDGPCKEITVVLGTDPLVQATFLATSAERRGCPAQIFSWTGVNRIK